MVKIHGSMIRSVKNMAPRVYKTERAEKRVVGRAKKRIQYTNKITNIDGPNYNIYKGPNAGSG